MPVLPFPRLALSSHKQFTATNMNIKILYSKKAYSEVCMVYPKVSYITITFWHKIEYLHTLFVVCSNPGFTFKSPSGVKFCYTYLPKVVLALPHTYIYTFVIYNLLNLLDFKILRFSN